MTPNLKTEQIGGEEPKTPLAQAFPAVSAGAVGFECARCGAMVRHRETSGVRHLAWHEEMDQGIAGQ